MNPVEAVSEQLAPHLPQLTGEQRADLSRGVLQVLHDQGWHGSSECPECEDDHCEAPEEHDGLHAAMAEAVQMLHAQAHNAPTDTVTAERCHREPCVTVGGGTVHGDARGLFAPGSRVVA